MERVDVFYINIFNFKLVFYSFCVVFYRNLLKVIYYVLMFYRFKLYIKNFNNFELCNIK